MNVPNTRSLALHEFTGIYRGIHSIEGKTGARVGEIAITINSSGVNIARATLEGTKKDAYTADEIRGVKPSEVEDQLSKDFRDFKAFRLGQRVMAISHRTDDHPSVIILGDPGFTSLFGPNQTEVFDQKISAITQRFGTIPRLSE